MCRGDQEMLDQFTLQFFSRVGTARGRPALGLVSSLSVLSSAVISHQALNWLSHEYRAGSDLHCGGACIVLCARHCVSDDRDAAGEGSSTFCNGF